MGEMDRAWTSGFSRAAARPMDFTSSGAPLIEHPIQIT